MRLHEPIYFNKVGYVVIRIPCKYLSIFVSCVYDRKGAARIMTEIVILIFLMALVTFIPRVLPILALSRRKLPEIVERWLSYVPVAVLAALLGPSLCAPTGAINITLNVNPAFWVSIPVFIIAVYTRSLFITVISGMVLIATVRLFIS